MERFREVTQEERDKMMKEGVFDINGNIPAHPGYTGIHRHKDGTYWFEGKQVTSPAAIQAIEDYIKKTKSPKRKSLAEKVLSFFRLS